MRPMNGTYSVHANDGAGHETTVVYTVTDAGIMTTFGLLVWVDDPNGGRFQCGEVAIRCMGNGSGVAVNGQQNLGLTCQPV